MNNKKNLAIITCISIAVISTYLGKLQNIIGAPMIGLFIGMIILNIMPNIDKEFKAGTSFAGKKFLKWGIILAGATLNFSQILGYGAMAMPLIIFNIILAFSVAYFVGKKLNLTPNTCTLVGGGSCICGGTAIATLASIIKAKEEEIAYAMTAIFLFDIFAALIYPYLAEAIGLTVNQFGILAGTAINDTSSVAAAEATYNTLTNGDSTLAITVKLARTTMLILVSIAATFITVRNESKLNKSAEENLSICKTVMKVFPWFIGIFLGMAILNTIGVFNIIPNSAVFFKTSYKFLITAALVGVGFKIQFKELFTKGTKPIILGGLTWGAVAISSLLFITIFSDFIG
ncbi:YeiH family protein [Senegalia massiliensis]|uniref:Putative sulfate exporter family transporter n=1 Tax=Senegalia massiliensis TaxID=1720316 RepID=A0A845QUJ7_9CLOT|nr:putative sulfate exporter family transporter [Senegalia massiliensis]NBI06195.1 putative sulfate exporter family transporter [Senegalia massiliensis]